MNYNIMILSPQEEKKITSKKELRRENVSLVSSYVIIYICHFPLPSMHTYIYPPNQILSIQEILTWTQENNNLKSEGVREEVGK
jgi:hypothetical protein